MAKKDVLDRVAADLANGHTQPAIQRLSSLVAAHPADLDLRRRLAAVYRMIGNSVEAGRWTYLHADADPHDVAAFERAFPSPRARLRKLRWRAKPHHAATEFARTRLESLHAESGYGATATVPAGISVRSIFAVALLAVLLALAIVGAVTAAQWM
jgi:hypothetical protein